jgi:adenosylcobinamide-phosphate synthase
MDAPMIAPLLAYLLDRILGDPPNRWHPVAWQGRFLAWAEGRLQGSGIRGQGSVGVDLARFAWGASALAAGMALSAGAAWGLMRVARSLPWPLRLLIEAGLLKLTLSSHGLDRAAGEVEAALRRDDLPAARRLLSWHLVSRDTRELNAEEVGGAAVESVAENLTDAFVAPLCAYMAGGLPGVWAYRFAQTADSMWGYHDEAHEWLGKPAARLDDALNWLPARLAAGLLAVATWLAEGRAAAANAWRTRCAQARNTASPNAGQTMATMAGALGVTLTKRGHYALAGGDAEITPDVLARGRRIVRVAAGLAVVAAVGVGAARVWNAKARR